MDQCLKRINLSAQSVYQTLSMPPNQKKDNIAHITGEKSLKASAKLILALEGANKCFPYFRGLLESILMKNTIAIRREDLSKRGEKRVAVTPRLAQTILNAGHSLVVQPGIHPLEGTLKRAFQDDAYASLGAELDENIDGAKVIFGLKEVEKANILNDKTYLCFSHTHKGQVKNKGMLKTFMDRGATLVDYELVTHDNGARIITAFTYFAGYAGMIDTLWTVGKRYAMRGISHPLSQVPQSIEKEDLPLIKSMLGDIGKQIETNGTPASLPPFINVILGTGKTSSGSQEIYDILPVKEIGMDELEATFTNGSRNQVYKCVLGITEMFRLKANASISQEVYHIWEVSQQEQHYFKHPEDFESNLEGVLPYASILMNCILWSPEFPMTMSRAFTKTVWTASPTLEAIGDITCDPEGSIEFSKETWIDNPVYIYNPATNESSDGFEGEGIAVMAVTNLPCEFSSDASEQFSTDMEPIFQGILAANHDAEKIEDAGLPAAIQRAAILWRGQLTEPFQYMVDYVAGA